MRFAGKSPSVGRHRVAVRNCGHGIFDIDFFGLGWVVAYERVSRLLCLRQIDFFDLAKVDLSVRFPLIV